MGRQVAIITGASMGIGEATASLFAARGYAVVLAARSAERLETVAARIRRAGGTALAMPTDVTDRAAVAALAQQTLAAYGRVDVLVNNAGRGLMGTVAAMDPDEFEALLRLNVVAPVLCLQAVVPPMRAQGGGVIVNVSSVAEKMPIPFLGPYSASKIALSYLSDAARMELSRDNIAVVNVLPGNTITAFGQNEIHAAPDPTVNLSRYRHLGEPIGVPPSVVAAAIWQAVERRPRQHVVGTVNRVGTVALRLLGGPIHPVITAAVNRYVPRQGEQARTPRDDLRLAGVVAAAGAALAGNLLARRVRHKA